MLQHLRGKTGRMHFLEIFSFEFFQSFQKKLNGFPSQSVYQIQSQNVLEVCYPEHVLTLLGNIYKLRHSFRRK